MILVKENPVPFVIGIAAFVSVLTFYVHFVVGGRRVAAPLLADTTLPLASKWLNYYCWHVTTVLLAFLSAGFVWLAIHPHQPSLVFLCALTAALSVLSAWVARQAGISPLRFPSTWLFATVALVSAAALLTA